MNVKTKSNTETKEAIHAAVASIAARCDGADTQDGIGFNGSDTKFGKRAAMIQPSDWTDGIAWAAYTMLVKYQTQLEAYGHPYETLPIPEEVVGGDGRDEARQKAREAEGLLSRFITWNNDRYEVRFQYDAQLVSAVRQFSGATWHKDDKFWSFNESAAKQLEDFAARYGFNTDCTFKTNCPVEDVIEEPENKRVLFREGNTLVFDFGYDEYLLQAVKGIKGRRWDSKRKVWIVPQTSLEDAVDLAYAWDFTFNEDMIREIDAIVDEGYRRENLSSAQEAVLEIPGLATIHPETKAPLELRPFQKAGVAYAVETRRCFIADEMGLGKTVHALAAVQHQTAYPCLVVCPASLKTNWQREVRTWLPGKTTHIVDNQVGVKNSDVVIINYDILSKQKDALAKVGFQSLVFDESHYAKNKDAQRTKALKALADSIPASGMVLALTGTPVLNRPLELVSQLEIIDRIEEFGGSWNFRKRYCDANHNGFGWDFNGCSNADELNELLRRTCYVRRNKEDVLKELPQKGRYSVETELTGKAMKNYRTAEADILAWLQSEGKGGTSAEHLSKITVLKRLAGEGKIDAATEWIETFLDSTGRKLIVFAHHISVVDALAEKFGGLRVAGKDSAEARQEAVDKFQNDPDAKVIVLNMKAGGVGLTLTAASDVLFVEQGWTPAEHSQAEDRCHRIGQDADTVSAWYLLAEGTIDDDIYHLIEQKRITVDAVTEGEDNSQDSVLKDLVKTLIERTNV